MDSDNASNLHFGVQVAGVEPRSVVGAESEVQIVANSYCLGSDC